MVLEIPVLYLDTMRRDILGKDDGDDVTDDDVKLTQIKDEYPMTDVC